jgi:prepilin-type N-terminal cleavage/methylation domain-containing protein
VVTAAPADRRPSQDGGFTLVELLVVIAILGILAGIVVFSVAGITDTGRKSACLTEASTVKTAMEAYQAKNHTYVTTMAALSTGPNNLLASAPASVDINTTTATTYTLKWIGTTGCAAATGNATP